MHSERWYSVLFGVVAVLVLTGGLVYALRGSSPEAPPADRSSPLSHGTGSIETPAVQVVSQTPTAPAAPAPVASSVSESPTAEPIAEATERTNPPPPSPSTSPTPFPNSTEPASSPSAGAASGAAVDLSGAWRIVDTITEGIGIGQTFAFDVTLLQSGAAVTGGNAELSLAGALTGATFVAQFNQPSGISGTFQWTLTDEGNGAGRSDSSVPNGGSSQLLRLR